MRGALSTKIFIIQRLKENRLDWSLNPVFKTKQNRKSNF